MRVIIRLVLFVVLVLIGVYLSLPSSDIPTPPPGSLVSVEPADTESVYRRAYYTNLSRSAVMQYYAESLAHPLLVNLNHPPEDAGILIRDQTRSNFLQEFVHPWKESLFVNGFVPTLPQDIIVRDGKEYASKMTVHLVPSTIVTRLTVLLATAIVSYLILRESRHV